MAKAYLMIAWILNINYIIKKCLIARATILHIVGKENKKYMINAMN